MDDFKDDMTADERKEFEADMAALPADQRKEFEADVAALRAGATAAWDAHTEYMYDHYGRRDPDCAWCGEPVVMQLQGFTFGGTWTTRRDHEGPIGGAGDYDPEALRCASSPTEQHDVLRGAQEG